MHSQCSEVVSDRNECIYQSPHGPGIELVHKTLKLLSQDVSVNYNPVVL